MIVVIQSGPLGATFINWSIHMLTGNDSYINEKNTRVPLMHNPLKGHTAHEHWAPARSHLTFDANDWHPDTILNLHGDYDKDPLGADFVSKVAALKDIKKVWLDDSDCEIPDSNIRHGEPLADDQSAILGAYNWWNKTRKNLQKMKEITDTSISPMTYNETGIRAMIEEGLELKIDESKLPKWKAIYDKWWDINRQDLTWRWLLPNYQTGELTGVMERWRLFYQARLTHTKGVL